MRSRSIAILLIFWVAALWPGKAWAQDQPVDTWIEYVFGEQITFHARLKSDLPVTAGTVFFQAAGDSRTGVGQAEVIPGADGSYELSYTHDLSSYPLKAFSDISYHWEISAQGGKNDKTLPERFYYEDNRFNWRTLQEKPFQVHWYEGDVPFAQNVLDAAQAGLQRIQELLPLPGPIRLDIYVYPDSRTLQTSLQPGNADWVAGHAEPELGVIVVALPPAADQRQLIDQRIPHELLHILLYKSTNLGYDNLPTWLSEGLASQAEMEPNPDYQVLLEDAARREELLPLASLCQSFPREASSALLSYAQSASFVHYIYSTFGTSGLQELVTAYANGLDCERGAEYALGKSLTQLERGWKQQNFSGGALSSQVTQSAWTNLLPWLALLAAMLIAPLILLARRLRVGSAASHNPH